MRPASVRARGVSARLDVHVFCYFTVKVGLDPVIFRLTGVWSLASQRHDRAPTRSSGAARAATDHLVGARR
jgi:hypothetical protein